MTKSVRMTITSVVEITAPVDDENLITLTDGQRSKLRQDMKRQMTEQARNTPGSKIKSIVISSIQLVKTP